MSPSAKDQDPIDEGRLRIPRGTCRFVKFPRSTHFELFGKIRRLDQSTVAPNSARVRGIMPNFSREVSKQDGFSLGNGKESSAIPRQSLSTGPATGHARRIAIDSNFGLGENKTRSKRSHRFSEAVDPRAIPWKRGCSLDPILKSLCDRFPAPLWQTYS